ncbi:sel1 repeat family protein [Nocardia cyriacigeorgica]|nr:sel1 repeat family protein [Nocardia cyriacigeorgica]
MVLLIGPSKAGKTRTLFEAVAHELPQARVVVPDRRSVTELLGCAEYRDLAEPVVVWLENLDEFLTAEHALTPRTLAALTTRAVRTTVVATLRSEKYDELNIDGELASDIRTMFEQAHRIRLEPTSADRQEQAAAAALYPGLDLSRYGIAEMLAGAPALLAYYRRGRTTARVSPRVAAFTAVVEVVIDWARIGRPDRIPEDRLLELARQVVDTRYSAYDITDTDLAAAIAEARLPLEGAGATTAIDSVWLTEPRIRGYRPFDYLQAADDDPHTPRPIPETFWYDATRSATDDILFAVATGAYFRGNQPAAIRLLQKPVDAGDTSAMLNLGLLLHEAGDVADAERWWRRAADSGDTGAMVNLGNLLHQRGDLADAERWWRCAADSGDTGAMLNLGNLLRERGELADAETWHLSAMFNLGNLHRQRGEFADAENWWRCAADGGHTGAMFNLGNLHRQRGDVADAELWWRSAADAGHADAMANLGILLYERGDVAHAERWWQRAAEIGDTGAMFNLGLMFYGRGGFADAERWYLRAADAGHTDAMTNLGNLLHERGDVAAAERWWQRAAEAGEAGP